MLSFELEDEKAADQVVDASKVFTLAESLAQAPSVLEKNRIRSSGESLRNAAASG